MRNLLTSLGSASLAAIVCLNLNWKSEYVALVGATEEVFIEDAEMNFSARVDTGAASCSMHAVDITVFPSDDTGKKPIHFYTENRDGEAILVKSYIDSKVKVKTSEGEEMRYKVPLTVVCNDHSKVVKFTLNDRRRMKYRMLLGRNWLDGDYHVDVSRKQTSRS